MIIARYVMDVIILFIYIQLLEIREYLELIHVERFFLRA